MAQVFVAATRKRCLKTPPGSHINWNADEGDVELHFQGQSKSHSLSHTDDFRFLEKAMIIDDLDASSKTRNPWRLCSVTQVEEVKQVLCLVTIWFSCVMFYVVQVQLHTFVTKQASTLVRSIGPHFQIPPASLQGTIGLTILATMPMHDQFFVPLARKFPGHQSYHHSVAKDIGLSLSILNMVVSAFVEKKRVSVAGQHHLLDHPEAVLPMSVWWLLPQHIITGVSDAFTTVGLQELFYDQVPEAMRSVGAAAYMSIGGVGSFSSNIVIVAVQGISSKLGEKWLGNNFNRAHLDCFYWVLARLCALNLWIYICLAQKFVYKKIMVVETNGVDSGLDM